MDTKTLISGLAVFFVGAGLFVAGLCVPNEVMTTFGSGLVGTALGWLGLKRPQD